jgi:hypothetical protein
VYDDAADDDVADDVADGDSPQLVHNFTKHIHAAAFTQEFLAWQHSARHSSSVTLSVLLADLRKWQAWYERQSNSSGVKLVKYVVGKLLRGIRVQRVRLASATVEDCERVTVAWQANVAASAQTAQTRYRRFVELSCGTLLPTRYHKVLKVVTLVQQLCTSTRLHDSRLH